MGTRILIVEDEAIVALDLRSRLEQLQYEVVGHARDSATALALAADQLPDVVLMDIQIAGDVDGISTAEIIRQRHDIPVLFLTAFSNSTSIDRAKRVDAYGYLLKPFQERELVITIEMALYKHRMEHEVRSQAALLKTTVNAVADGILTIDQEERIVFMNPAAERMTGWKEDEARNRKLADVVVLQEADRHGEEFPGAIEVLHSRSGSQTEVEVSRSAVSDEEGVLPRCVVVLRDVTAMREYEQSLITAREEALGAARLKSEFIARISHELRTPLNVIHGMIDLVQQQPLTEETREHLALAARSTAGLDRLIAEIIGFSAQDVDTAVTLHIEPFVPDTLLHDMAESHAPEAARQGLRIVAQSDPALLRTVRGDVHRVRRILENLLSNAIKFTGSGHVIVSGELVAHREDAPQEIIFRVHDTGIGIPEGERDGIFDDFYQIADSRTRSAGGMGLGLAIARRLARAMSGDIEVESSSMDHGTTVVFRLPVELAEEQNDGGAAVPRWADALRGVTIVSGDELATRVVAPWQQHIGVTLEVLRDGTPAVPEGAVVLVPPGGHPGASGRTLGAPGTPETVSLRTIAAAVSANTPDTTATAAAGAGGTAHTMIASLQAFLAAGDSAAALEETGRLRRLEEASAVHEACFRVSLALRRGDLEQAQAILEEYRKQEEERGA